MNNENCPQNVCGNNLSRAIRKIQEDSQYKPTCCFGPTGPTGATGPTGPTGTIPTTDSILVANDRIQTVTSSSNINFGDIINQTGSTSIIYTAPDTISLAPGTYFILFSSLVSNTNIAGDIGASLEIDGNVIPTSSEYVAASTTPVSVVLQHSVTVTGPDVSLITISNSSNVSNNYHDSNISIIKIA